VAYADIRCKVSVVVPFLSANGSSILARIAEIDIEKYSRIVFHKGLIVIEFLGRNRLQREN